MPSPKKCVSPHLMRSGTPRDPSRTSPPTPQRPSPPSRPRPSVHGSRFRDVNRPPRRGPDRLADRTRPPRRTRLGHDATGTRSQQTLPTGEHRNPDLTRRNGTTGRRSGDRDEGSLDVVHDARRRRPAATGVRSLGRRIVRGFQTRRRGPAEAPNTRRGDDPRHRRIAVDSSASPSSSGDGADPLVAASIRRAGATRRSHRDGAIS